MPIDDLGVELPWAFCQFFLYQHSYIILLGMLAFIGAPGRVGQLSTAQFEVCVNCMLAGLGVVIAHLLFKLLV